MEQVEINEKEVYYFEQSPIWKAIAHMALPMMLGMCMNLIYNIVEIISTLLFNNLSVIYGDYVLAAFGIFQRVVQLSDFIGMGLFLGVVPLIAYSYAAKNSKRMLDIIRHTAFYIAILVILVSSILMIFRIQVFHMFTRDVKVINIGGLIFMAMLFSSLFTSISGLFIGIFQGLIWSLTASEVLAALMGIKLWMNFKAKNII